MIHDDLLKQADALARMDARRPKQVNLRRAVSSAYYAVYHLLVHEASSQLANSSGAAPAQTAHHAVRRWFSHGTTAATCRWFALGKGAPKELNRLFPPSINAQVSAELRAVAQAFVDLQGQRHTADYDIGADPFTRQGVLLHVQRAERAFTDWKVARADPLAPLFLLLLLTGDTVIVQR